MHWVKPAMMEQYQAVLERAIAALREAEHPLGWTAFRVRFGEGDYVYVTTAGSAAELYSAPEVVESVAKALGRETADQMDQQFRDSIWKYETSDWHPRPDLSYMPQTQSAEAPE